MTTFPDDADGEALANLAAQGVDMSQPQQFEYFVAVADEDSAESVASALIDAGYECAIEYDEGDPVDGDGEGEGDDEDPGAFGPAWTVYVMVSMVPDYNEVVRIQKEIDRIADPLGGTSDGWGVLVE